MTQAARKQATYEDVLNAPPNKVAELIEGTLHLQPRPAMRHARAMTKLASGLDDPFDRGRSGPGGWWLLFEPELHLGANVLVPDLAGWRRERLPELPDVAAMELAPDWVCEAISPSTGALDRVKKMPLYAQAGVRWCWLLDAHQRTIEAFRQEAGRWVLLGAHAGNDQARIEPFDAVAIDLSMLWIGKEPTSSADDVGPKL